MPYTSEKEKQRKQQERKPRLNSSRITVLIIQRKEIQKISFVRLQSNFMLSSSSSKLPSENAFQILQNSNYHLPPMLHLEHRRCVRSRVTVTVTYIEGYDLA